LNWINGVEVRDPERARRLFDVTLSGLDWIASTIRDHDLRVRFRRHGCLECFTTNERAEAAHAKAEKLASWGIPVRYLQGEALKAQVAAEGVRGGVLDPTAGQLHGLDFVYALRGLALAQGAAIYEDSPVVSIEEGSTITVTTPGGRVRAPALVLATNGYTGRLGYFRSGILPLHSHCIATEPLTRERWAELGWGASAGFTDDMDRIAFASMTPDGRLLFGGGSNASYGYCYGDRTSFAGDPAAGYDAVRRTFLRYFPRACDVRIGQQWTGTLGITLSRVCSMGVRGEHKNLYYALGYSGHGVVLANLAGQVLCDLYSDHHEPWRDLPFYQRPLGGIPPDPCRWAGYHAYTAVTGRSPRRSEP
jgi:glycine/D-amino acid oxidase-like deaminating enzyme